MWCLRQSFLECITVCSLFCYFHRNILQPQAEKEVEMRVFIFSISSFLMQAYKAAPPPILPWETPSTRREFKRTLVFCNTIKSCRAAEFGLREADIPTLSYHGDVPSDERATNLDRFKAGEVEYLVRAETPAWACKHTSRPSFRSSRCGGAFSVFVLVVLVGFCPAFCSREVSVTEEPKLS